MVALLSPSLDGEMFITANIGAALGFFLLASKLSLMSPKRLTLAPKLSEISIAGHVIKNPLQS